LIWTVFSSMTRQPASHDSTRFWAIWVWGPAAGPSGDDGAWRWKRAVRSWLGLP
jgi:hypothetical protein